MGIHYDYKSKRGERAMQKQAKREARLALKKSKKVNNQTDEKEETKIKPKIMHDIQKPITLEDLTNPDKGK
tara:strand:+ start:545 stop:757 length:213 start_codon:yes stop_codon:yes gene_type:complete